MHPDRRSALIVVVFVALVAAVAGPWTPLQWPSEAAQRGASAADADASFGHRVTTAFPTAAAGFAARGPVAGG